MKTQRFWFRTNQNHSIWYPATWEAWIITSIAILLLLCNYYRISSESFSVIKTIVTFSPQALIVALLYVATCYKTGEQLRWLPQ